MKALAICYYDVPTIIESVENLKDHLRLSIVENHSIHTPTIQGYMLGLLSAGQIDQYIYFRENISNNAFSEALAYYDTTQKYLMFTDGDVTCCDDFVSEQVKILESCPEVAFVSVRLDKSNLPVEAFPEAYNWIPPVISEHDLYIEQYSGHQLVMMRGEDFGPYNRFRIEKNWSWTDGSMRQWAYSHGRKWAVTRNSTAKHLTWTLYQNREHPYTKLKLEQSMNETWDHKRTALYNRFVK